MKIRPRPVHAAPFLAALLLAGCFSLSPSAPTTRYYVLGDAPAGGADVPTLRSDVTIGLTKITISPYLEGVRIVVRRGDNQISFSEFDRWGEDLDRAINRSVAAHLTRMLPVRRVEAAPWSAGIVHDLVVQIRVQRFEGVMPLGAPRGADGAAHLSCTWEVMDPETRAVVASGRTDHLENGWSPGDYDELVAMLDEALVVLSREIAAAVPGL